MIVLRQSLYARADYEGLDPLAKAQLKAERNQLAKELAAKRNKINNEFTQKLNEINNNPSNPYRSAESIAAEKVIANRSRTTRYKQALGDVRADAEFVRKDLLRDTARRAEEGIYNKPKNIPTSAPAKQTVTNTTEKGLANSGKFLKKAGLGALAVAGAAGIGYGLKKYYDNKKKKESETYPSSNQGSY